MKKVCGAKLRNKDKTCQKSPMANGRCRLHGGATPSGPDNANFKHGRYANAFKGKLAEKFDKASADDKPLDLLPELAVQRSLLADYIESVSGKKVITAGAIGNLSSLVNDVVKTATMIAKVRNDEALTLAELKFIKQGMMMLMEKYVPDADRRRNYIAELVALIPDRTSTEESELASLPAGAGEAIKVT